ncbi:YraN family protein [Anaerostipes sp.]|uniref:YraN family protein n=1 Tax=Anaerostipes sp. TaxID=1872530 RepID=UPI0025BB1619|nr:YraN family protein [Anaerostipes sp.]MBS7008387.1 YraN family protein [Anaerostipes sp.]
MRNQRKTGMEKEETACRFLVSQGYEILERNFYSRRGEIDIVARDGEYLVFIEVKYRKNAEYGYPSEAVNAKKQQRIRRTAEYYLYSRSLFPVPARFDVVEILGKKIRVIKNAF